MKHQRDFTIVELFIAMFSLIVLVGGLGGWIYNIVKIAQGTLTPMTTEMLLRLIGIFIEPLGAVMGWL